MQNKKKAFTKKDKKNQFFKKLLKQKQKIGIIHVRTCRNNMKFTLTTLRGNLIATESGGTLGYRNAQKKTWTTVFETAKKIGIIARQTRHRYIYLNIRGYCPKRIHAFRGLQRTGCRIVRVIYRIPAPYNGCRGFTKARK
jgi:small subunit ribosomal protein S11